MTELAGTVETVEFGGLAIAFDGDGGVLRPRAWTIAQSRWAAELLPRVPPGPVLEVCAGVGHIGLAAVAGSGRHLVLVDSSAVAAAFARRNVAAALGPEAVDVRCGEMGAAVRPGERFAFVIADPPWVSSAEVAQHPDDPEFAIDGGPDGLDVAEQCAEVIDRVLVPGGAAIIQLGSSEQATKFAGWLTEATSLRARETRDHRPGGVLVLLERSAG